MIKMYSDIEMNRRLSLAEAVGKVINTNWYILGAEVTAFEEEFAHYVGSQHCVSVANGTDAIELALKALDISVGDVVATVANAGFYSSTAIHKLGAIPLYIDVDEHSMTMCPTALSKTLSHDVKCIVVTHLYGQLAEVEAIRELADRHDIPLIEDCAQSHGATRSGKQAGSWGDAACFSFYPTKNLGALGDGGAVITSNDLINKRLRILRQYGWSSKYNVDFEGGCNSRLDEIQAAILRQKLPHLDAWNEDRRRVAKRYNDGLQHIGALTLPKVDSSYVGHLYVTRCNRRSELQAYLKSQGVASDIHYPIPDHRQKAYQGKARFADLGNTEKQCNEVLTLPCYPFMDDSDITKVIEAVASFFAR